MLNHFKSLCLHANDPSLCNECNGLYGYGLKKHTHKCLGCGWTSNPQIDPDCPIPPTVDACIMCREDHVWLKDLRSYMNMLSGEIKLPHTIGECFICGRARLKQIKYQQQIQLNVNDSCELITNDLKEIIIGTVNRLKRR